LDDVTSLKLFATKENASPWRVALVRPHVSHQKSRWGVIKKDCTNDDPAEKNTVIRRTALVTFLHTMTMMMMRFPLLMAFAAVASLTTTAVWSFQPSNHSDRKKATMTTIHTTIQTTTRLYNSDDQDWSSPSSSSLSSPDNIQPPSGPQRSGPGRLERLEYTIYPDGRVTQKVFGVKGPDCLKLTKEIEDELGVVISTEYTEEYYEEPVMVNTVVNVVQEEQEGGGGANNGGGGWEGTSTW
jgi:Protein of unknown function (DUF2997)